MRGRAPGRVALIVAPAFLVAACAGMGSGDLVTEQREVGSFDSISASGGVNVELVVDPAGSEAVSVTYDDNIIDRVVTRVSGGTLFIEFEGSVSTFGGGRFVKVTASSLTAVEASGGSDVHGSGSVDAYRVEASGGADVDLRDVAAREVVVEASGGADIRVFASESVEGSASGGSDVTVYGDPAQARVDTSGGADVHFQD